jgi:hypothetical protein
VSSVRIWLPRVSLFLLLILRIVPHGDSILRIESLSWSAGDEMQLNVSTGQP